MIMRFVLALPFVLFLTVGAAHAEIRTERVEYRHGELLLEGYLAYDDAAEGARPGVVVFHEWWGQDEYVRQRARQLAEMGYVAFAADMYGKGVHADNPQEAQRLAGQVAADPAAGRERARLAVEKLVEAGPVDPQRIAAIGYCFGGTVALELARSGEQLSGVVSFHGSLAARLPAQQVRSRVLVLHGADDPLVSREEIQQFVEEMQRLRADWQFVSYGGAVHSFTNPHAGRHGIPGVAYNETADRRSWQHMKLFFEEIFRQED
jgi:dienelactone hydrolase